MSIRCDENCKYKDKLYCNKYKKELNVEAWYWLDRTELRAKKFTECDIK